MEHLIYLNNSLQKIAQVMKKVGINIVSVNYNNISLLLVITVTLKIFNLFIKNYMHYLIIQGV